MSETKFKIAAVQMVSTPDVDANLKRADALIAEAAAQGARLQRPVEKLFLVPPGA